METISTKKQKARKEHKCSFCIGIIKISETYTAQFNKQDGDVYIWKSHIHCEEIASKLNMYDWCDYGLDSDTFQEYINQEFMKYEEEKYPSFEERLKYVCEKHGINTQNN